MLLGEVDVIRTLQLLPGVTTVGEGAPGFNVRGGNVDQNLVLLDEAPVFSSSHLIGFLSAFNPDAVKNVKLYKGNVPARYGGRLSSVLEVHQKEGNTKQFGLRGGVGLLSSRLLLEGPIQQDKSSFMIAGRRSYGDVLYDFVSDDNIVLYFYDVNAKANYKIGERNHLYLSGYLGRDVSEEVVDGIFYWGNYTSTLRWNHLFSKKLFSNLTAAYSHYHYRLDFSNSGSEVNLEDIDWRSSIKHYSLRADMTYFSSPESTLDFGVSSTLYGFNPGTLKITKADEPDEVTLQVEEEQAVEVAAYAAHKQEIGNHMTLKYGLRYTAFLNVGERDVFTYENNQPSPDNAITDTLAYRAGELIKFYDGLAPRFSLDYTLNNRATLKASYNRLFQYVQLASNTAAPTPLDIWTPANQYIPPAIADQVALGFFGSFRRNTLEFSSEIYYKHFQDLIDFRNGAELILKETLETELLSGRGRAYGLELMLKKPQGRWTGWLSYTLSRTERQVEGINNGAFYPANYDKPHDVSLVLNYQLSEKWNASANFVYMTGRPITVPAGRFEYEGIVIPDYTSRNGARTPDYHRADLSFNYEPLQSERRWRSSWSLGVYNLYGRQNPYSVFFRPNENNPGKTEAVQISVFARIIPSITYNFSF